MTFNVYLICREKWASQSLANTEGFPVLCSCGCNAPAVRSCERGIRGRLRAMQRRGIFFKQCLTTFLSFQMTWHRYSSDRKICGLVTIEHVQRKALRILSSFTSCEIKRLQDTGLKVSPATFHSTQWRRFISLSFWRTTEWMIRSSPGWSSAYTEHSVKSWMNLSYSKMGSEILPSLEHFMLTPLVTWVRTPCS